MLIGNRKEIQNFLFEGSNPSFRTKIALVIVGSNLTEGTRFIAE